MKLGLLSRERWTVVEPVLDAALELEPDERSAFLDNACRGDAKLRAEVESLLAACDLGDSILSNPAAIEYAPLLADAIPAVPRLLGGRYHIVREIGRGGMGTVYLADDPKHARQVAVKTLHADVAQLIGRERFAREIEIAAGLSHPHILPLHDSGEAGSDEPGGQSFLYFITPFAAGESLRDRLLREPKIELEEAVRLGREVALALDYAHRRGVVHLDIKPGNILLQEGHAVIADFGIARAMSSAGDAALAKSSPPLGTPSYMSPEQALNLPDVDGRSDVYSLGCVLYEMLTGQPPLARVTTPDPEGKAGASSVPGALERAVPRELAAVILRAIAPSRDERYRTAGDLATALGKAVQHGRSRSWKRAAITVASIVVAAAASLAFWESRSAPTLDPNLVAVAPFDVASPALLLWKEGMIDVLSRSLDGAGALRSVPASVVVHRWQGRADVESAHALGEATGARLVLFGGIMSAGDSVRATMSLLDVRTGRTVAEFERKDIPGRMDRLSDSLALAVLQELGRSRRIDMAHATFSPTASLAALKAYLQGEQFYRVARWDSAQVHFERAIDLDTTFALAYHRLGAVRRFRDAKFPPDSVAYELMRKTSHFPKGLGPRERLLATIDSLSSEAYFARRRALKTGDYNIEDGLVTKLCDALIEAQRLYPNDAEFAFLHAEARAEYDRDVAIGEIDDRGALARYEKAIALDSGFAPAYVTPIALSAYLDGAPRAQRYIRAYLALAPSGTRSELIRLAGELLDPARASQIDVAKLVDTMSTESLCGVAEVIRHIPDSAEVIVRMARAVAARQHPDSGGPAVTQDCVTGMLVNGLEFRGHLREAERLAVVHAHALHPGVLYNMARFGLMPYDSSRALFKEILSLAPRTRISKLYRWFAADGDTAAIQTYIAGYLSAARPNRTVSVNKMLQSSASAGHAYLALARHDTAGAIKYLMTTSDTLHTCWYENRVMLARLLVATGR
jgi:serine/threonine-protein kinase